LLRRAGLPVGPAEMLAAQNAVALVDIGRRDQVRTALRTTMVHRHEHAGLFDQAFVQFWRDPTLGKTAAAMALLDAAKQRPPERAPPGARRIAEALATPREPPRQEVEAILSVSENERLQQMDFEAMSAAEIEEAKKEIARLVLPLGL